MMENANNNTISHQSEDTPIEWRWCIVGNIVESHSFGQYGETRIGTKQFRPGAKVYCSIWNWGDGGEHYPVIGLPRHGKRLITVIMPSKYITNFRIQKVFNPAVLKEMERDERFWFSNSDKDRDDILRYLKSCEDNGLTVIKNEIWDTYAEAAGRFPKRV